MTVSPQPEQMGGQTAITNYLTGHLPPRGLGRGLEGLLGELVNPISLGPRHVDVRTMSLDSWRGSRRSSQASTARSS